LAESYSFGFFNFFLLEKIVQWRFTSGLGNWIGDAFRDGFGMKGRIGIEVS
jgi:hypothetical protein